MPLRIASAEIVSVLFLLIILLSLWKKTEKNNPGNGIFVALTLSAIAGLIFDALGYITEEYRTDEIILVLINIMAFSTIDICIILFSFYLIRFIREKVNVSYRPVYPAIAISVLNILMIIVGYFNGRFFKVEDHRFVYGPWKDYMSFMPVLSLIVILIILIVYAKDLGKRDTVVLASFVICPAIATVILLFLPDYGMGYVSIALSCAIIFTFVRREEIIEAYNREQIIKEVATMDTLTGLLNRRGFNEVIEQNSDHESLGIVFCDLNALKYTNDNFGHAAGDAYIQRFAGILRQIFDDEGKICRISGDEFVVLLFDISRDGFYALKDQLKQLIKENERIASVGFAYSENAVTMELLRQAEQRMYDDKNRYYKETGIDRRRCF